MRVIGRIISCMDRAFTLGKMEGSSMGSTKTIRKMEKDHFIGQTAESTTEVGRMAASMEKGCLNLRKEFQRKAFGRMASESVG
jgi:lipocalin